MNRKANALTSLGVSMALIAAVIYFLLYLYGSAWGPGDSRSFWHHGWTMGVGGHGLGIIVLIFWIMLTGAVVLLILGVVSRISRR